MIYGREDYEPRRFMEREDYAVSGDSPFADLVPANRTTAAPTYQATAQPTYNATSTPAPTSTAGYPSATELARYNSAGGLLKGFLAIALKKKYGNNWNVAGPAQPTTPTPTTPAPTTPTTPATPTTPTTPTTPAPTPAQQQKSMTDLIRSTPGYKFQLEEGLKSLNANAYAKGMGNSGATFKALEQYGQNLADNYYQQYLANTMAVASQGMDAAGAIAGAGNNMGAGVAGALNNAAQAHQNSANAAANAAYQKANANTSMYQGIAGGIGQMAGSIFGSSYRGY